MPDQEPDHASNDRSHGDSLPRMVMHVIVGHIAHVLGRFTDSTLHFAETSRHIGFLVCFVCTFHMFFSPCHSRRAQRHEHMSKNPHSAAAKLPNRREAAISPARCSRGSFRSE